MWRTTLAAALLASVSVLADEVVYSDSALSSTWQDWSWGSTIDYDATDLYEGTSSISVNSTGYSALSLYDTAFFTGDYAGLSFDIAADPSTLTFEICNTNVTVSIPLTDFGLAINSTGFTTVVVNFGDLPPTGTALGNGSYDRLNWQAGTDGAVFHLDNIVLLSSITIVPEILSAEPLATNIIAVTTQGDADLSSVKVTLNKKALSFTGKPVTYSPPDTPAVTISYLELATPFSNGNLSISTANGTFDYVLGSALTGSVNQEVNYPISNLIYGMNFPTDASYIQELGITLSRWGGNAETAYNPDGDFTNAGNDWYFENRANGANADEWVQWVTAAGSDTILLVPALDWVAKDATNYSYPKSTYPDQESFDPYNGLAGDGMYPNGTAVSPPADQTVAYTPWNTSLAKAWLSGLVNKPSHVTIDNEIEIASSTHQDMHPDPIDYDEELARVLNFSTVIKEALPDVNILAPSTDSWWFYWTSVVGETDTAAHNNTDFLPWFLQQMAAHDKATGKRLLDYLDLHYYFAADTSANDADALAMRLRLSRSLWDPTYVDESWIGEDTPQNHQPNATIVQLIPRFQKLIDEYYPGTKLSVSEWDSQNDTDVTGGLLTADCLGVFGKYKLDAATYWEDSVETSAAGLGFWLYRGNGTTFGSSSAEVKLPALNPDTLGVYAGTESNKLTLVVINKDPSNPVTLDLSGVPTGSYFMRHFGGAAGIAKYQTTISLAKTSYIVVPSYTAVFLQEL